MIEGAILLLLEASASEVLSRSAWTMDDGLPRKRAAAAGFLAYLGATRERAAVTATLLGPILTYTLWRFLR